MKPLRKNAFLLDDYIKHNTVNNITSFYYGGQELRPVKYEIIFISRKSIGLVMTSG